MAGTQIDHFESISFSCRVKPRHVVFRYCAQYKRFLEQQCLIYIEINRSWIVLICSVLQSHITFGVFLKFLAKTSKSYKQYPLVTWPDYIAVIIDGHSAMESWIGAISHSILSLQVPEVLPWCNVPRNILTCILVAVFVLFIFPFLAAWNNLFTHSLHIISLE